MINTTILKETYLQSLRESHTWMRTICISLAISMCIAVDILQYSFPLSFLPRSLEDGGHSSKHIAAVIGGYYWSGFAGGVLITLWQIYRILFCQASTLSFGDVRKQILYLVGGLFVGSVTLLKQGQDDSYTVHIVCRIIQGFVGAILFFYSYLLSIELFSGKHQIFALTLNTIALNIAEVGGPLLGATVFTVSGQSSSFYFLTAVSFLNQFVLLVALWWIRRDSQLRTVVEVNDNDDNLTSDDEQLVESLVERRVNQVSPVHATGFSRFLDIISSPYLWKALTVIAPSALLKAEIENILPLFADHSMGYSTMDIGYSFSAVAATFVLSSISIGLAWDYMSQRVRDTVVGFSLICLCAFSTAILPLTELTGLNPTVFMGALASYGVFLGLTITPSSFMLGEFVDSLRDSQSKDVANGIWNTLWEMGGSVGFFISGVPKSNDWKAEQTVISLSSVVLLIAAVAFYYVNDIIRKDNMEIKIADEIEEIHDLESTVTKLRE